MEQITELIKGGDPGIIANYMLEHGLTISDGKIVPNAEKKEWVAGQIGFWDQRQQAR